MAHHMLQVGLNNLSLLPRDVAMNVLWYDINGPDTTIGTMDDVAAAYVAQAIRFSSNYNGITIKAFDPAGGPATETKTYAFVGGANPVPSEVALCLSYSATDNVAGAPRFRGRIYLPLGSAASRPTVTQMNAVLALGQGLAAAGNAGNTTWKMRSRIGTGTALNPVPVFRKIESISVDDEWDTQRSRGMRATQRIRQDVQ